MLATHKSRQLVRSPQPGEIWLRCVAVSPKDCRTHRAGTQHTHTQNVSITRHVWCVCAPISTVPSPETRLGLTFAFILFTNYAYLLRCARVRTRRVSVGVVLRRTPPNRIKVKRRTCERARVCMRVCESVRTHSQMVFVLFNLHGKWLRSSADATARHIGERAKRRRDLYKLAGLASGWPFSSMNECAYCGRLVCTCGC